MRGTISVFVERRGDAVAAISFELIAAARDHSARVRAFVAGEVSNEVIAVLSAHGVTNVVGIDHDPRSLIAPAVANAIAMHQLAGSGDEAILLGATYDGRDVAARLSVRLDRPVLTNVVGLDREEDSLVSSHALFGGTAMVKARFSGDGPGIFVVRSKSFEGSEIGGQVAEHSTVSVSDLGAVDAARIVARHVERQAGPSLDSARVVVSGGRGLGEASRYGLIEELASSLGGAAGASRAIVDAGWVPYAHQVGQTGKTVKPDVYLAFGISGATQHVAGMKDAKTIIAVNRDPEAPIFQIADLAVIGDATTILPRLLEAVQKETTEG